MRIAVVTGFQKLARPSSEVFDFLISRLRLSVGRIELGYNQ